METALQIAFRNIEPSPIVEKWIRNDVAKLNTFYDRIIACRVAAEVPHRHHRRGCPYRIRVDVTVPGEVIVVKREPCLSSLARRSGEAKIERHLGVKSPHKSLRRAINDAFKAIGRRLQDYARRQRGDVKRHALRVGD